jgi:uncharacterized protein (TIGR00266 family)
MEFMIENAPVFTILRVKMAKGETWRAEAGAMISMSPTIELEAKSAGKGFLGAVKAAVGGEGLFASLYTAAGGNGELVLAPGTPGDIVRFDLRGQAILAQGGAYLAGSPDLELSTQGSFKALISGEGLFLQRISGTGTVFLNSYGAILEKKLGAGESYVVDTGHIVAFEESVKYQLKKAAKGLFSTLASGEGLVASYTGPGAIWMQTRNLPAFAAQIGRFLPKQNG